LGRPLNVGNVINKKKRMRVSLTKQSEGVTKQTGDVVDWGKGGLKLASKKMGFMGELKLIRIELKVAGGGMSGRREIL